MVLRFMLTDSQPGKCIFDPFPSRFQDFGTFPRRLHGLEARYLSGLRPGRPNSDKSGFPGRTEKLRAEKSCRLMVVSHRVLHFSSLLCPFKIVDFQLILLISGVFHLLIRPSECSLNLSVNRICLSFCLSVPGSACLCIFLSARLPACLSSCLLVCLSVCSFAGFMSVFV